MDNKLIMGLMGVVIGVLLLGSLLVPVIKDAQINAGDEVTLNNVIKGDSPKYEMWDGSDITLSYDSTTGTYSVNGVSNSWAASSQRIIIASNDFAARNGGVTDSPQLQTQYVSLDTQVINRSFTFTVVNHEYTLTIQWDVPVTYTGVVDWLVYADDNGTANLGQIPQTVISSFYTSLSDDVIVLGNIYASGSYSTFYSYYNGVLTVNEEYANDSEVNIVKNLVDGYTDIYTTSIEIDILDESFVPYYILAPISIQGHGESGATYSIYGVIPVIMIVALMVGTLSFIRNRD